VKNAAALMQLRYLKSLRIGAETNYGWRMRAWIRLLQ